VWATTAAAAVTVGTASADLARTGVERPLTAAIGLIVCLLVNRVFVVVARRGDVLEGIDITEAPLVALALLLPPGEAILTFLVASALLELPADRAGIKKVFNFGIRAAGAGLLVTPLALINTSGGVVAGRLLLGAVGAVLYTVANALAVASVAGSVQGRPAWSLLRDGLGPRLLVWCLAVVIGLSSAFAADRAPGTLAGAIALLTLVSLTAEAARRAQRESERLQHLLDASTRIQETEGVSEQEGVLLAVAGELLLWRDLSIRDDEPGPGERGAQLHRRHGQERWLVAAPRVGSNPWTPEDERTIETLASAAAVAFERAGQRAELARQALLDPLTGVANRRRFDEEVARLAARPQLGFGIVLCDLDDFKTVNDRLGHEAGDELLRIAAGRLSASVRPGDLVARLGGDEFVVLLPEVTTRASLEAVRRKVAARFDEPLKVGRWQLSCLPSSFGVAAMPRDGLTVREVMRAADESMYDVKRLRRNAAPVLDVTLPDATVPAPRLVLDH
jgi:diguanylate cyclase (GGDEF)-like protein